MNRETDKTVVVKPLKKTFELAFVKKFNFVNHPIHVVCKYVAHFSIFAFVKRISGNMFAMLHQSKKNFLESDEK